MRHGWTQEQAEEESGVPQTTISGLETGRITRSSPDTLARLARAYHVSRRSLYAAAGLIEADDVPLPDGALGLDDPLLDVLRWVREDPQVVADLAEAKETMTPRVYEAYVREMAKAWKANFWMQRRTWELAHLGDS
jgi:transcriptional regulator with XRE-family HTH domain